MRGHKPSALSRETGRVLTLGHCPSLHIKQSMSAAENPSIPLFFGRAHRAVHALLACGIALCFVAAPHGASAANLTVLVGDDQAASVEFVQQLRTDQSASASGRFELVRIA